MAGILVAEEMSADSTRALKRHLAATAAFCIPDVVILLQQYTSVADTFALSAVCLGSRAALQPAQLAAQLAAQLQPLLQMQTRAAELAPQVAHDALHRTVPVDFGDLCRMLRQLGAMGAVGAAHVRLVVDLMRARSTVEMGSLRRAITELVTKEQEARSQQQQGAKCLVCVCVLCSASGFS